MEYPHFSFTITAQDGLARCGTLKTPHGDIETPAFIFCATKAAIRVATPQVLREENTQIILGNTYHLMLQPGADVIERAGGLQKFTGWHGPMLTDSGGFQVFSLGDGTFANEIKSRREGKYARSLLGIHEEGATFRSYLDGSKKTLTPESAIEIQRKIGADLILVLDECTPYNVTREYTADSLALTNRWALRSLKEFQRTHTGKQALYGITQGGVYEDLRRESSEFISEQPFFGHAVGGTLGGDKAEMYAITAWCMQHLKKERPVHLLGVGGLQDIWENVALGIDTFDCVHPTRLARHNGASYNNSKERLNLRNARYAEDDRPLDENCQCYTCRTFSRRYLHHLVKSGEPLGFTLLAIHNIHFMNKLMTTIRNAIQTGSFQEAKKAWYAERAANDCDE